MTVPVVNNVPRTLRAFVLGSVSCGVKDALAATGIQLVESQYSRMQDIVLASLTCQILLINKQNTLSHVSGLTSLGHWIAIAYMDRDGLEDIKHCTNIPVFLPKPAPSRVTARSAAEFVIGRIFHLARQISSAHTFEVRNKTLGIIGYGSVGIQISSMAEALGMRVLFYDTIDIMSYGRAKSTPTVSALLQQSDIVTIHVPANTELMLAEREISQIMPKGSCLIDISHSSAVDHQALATALKDGHIFGAAVDLPFGPSRNALCGISNVLLTYNARHATQEVADAVAKNVLMDLSLYLDQLNVPIKNAINEDHDLEHMILQPTFAK
ncbi:hypothetical protein BGW37DRAFT_490252 [Umbelopsis sp. PMI_123]|nr:hypothetical protein BGW37DRAFT_490252 [Umbelopsis sp. PMI_123]